MSFTTEEIAELYAEETAPIAEPVSRRACLEPGRGVDADRAARVAAKLGAWADGVPLAALGGDRSAQSVFARRMLVRRMLAAGLSAYRVATMTTFQYKEIAHVARRRH